MKKKQKYQLLDTGNFKKLEQVGPYRLIRPAAQAVWSPSLGGSEWINADAEFVRSKQGEGRWEYKNKNLPSQWKIDFFYDLKMFIKLTDFGHIGIFPEHHEGSQLQEIIRSHKGLGEFRILNLFAYTGAISLLAASLGAHVTHVDASKTSVQWAKENAKLCDKPLNIRWIVDDVKKFCARELRRNSYYDAIILDPPSFGRGPKGEIWKIEEDIDPFLENLKKLLKKDSSFVQLSAHSPGFTPLVLKNLLSSKIKGSEKEFASFEMTIKEQSKDRLFPCGACCLFAKNSRGMDG